ncbi:type II toxin-antitoxin system PemK/MazF family toxin [Streptomyces sp. NPDC059785]|uniref:type II toxin-antitoxin system PemK/MazF family toxin n=1 Tax=unclassified Streptomyces TaxID=2593676 RepID=UPI00365B1B1A
MTVRKGDIWDVDTGKGTRTVLVVSLDGLADAYGAVVALVLHAPAAHPDTAMSVRLTSPVDASVVAVNLLQLAASRFETGTRIGTIGPEQQELVDNALRAVLDL